MSSCLDILVGYSERDGDMHFNSAILVSSVGKLFLNYPKMHLWGEFEHAIYQPGESAPVVRLSDQVCAGVLICFDPEIAAAAQDLVR